jgi:hypothetical protein
MLQTCRLAGLSAFEAYYAYNARGKQFVVRLHRLWRRDPLLDRDRVVARR